MGCPASLFLLAQRAGSCAAGSGRLPEPVGRTERICRKLMRPHDGVLPGTSDIMGRVERLGDRSGRA